LTDKILISQTDEPLTITNLDSLSPALRNLKQGLGLPELRQDTVAQTKSSKKRVMQPATKSFLRTAGSPLGSPLKDRAKRVPLNERDAGL
jgi:hypothetical protein